MVTISLVITFAGKCVNQYTSSARRIKRLVRGLAVTKGSGLAACGECIVGRPLHWRPLAATQRLSLPRTHCVWLRPERRGCGIGGRADGYLRSADAL